LTPELLANVALGYVLGSIPFGLIVGYLWLGRDIRASGSGKTGTTNVLRTAGRRAAVTVLAADILKGVVPAVIGRVILDDPAVAAAGAAAAVVGHVWPVFAGFRGGRGVATAFGGFLGLDPLLGLAFPVLAAALLVPWRIVSVMSVFGAIASSALVLAAWGLGWTSGAYAAYGALAAAFITYTHIPNLRRLARGLEPRLGHGGDRPATG